MIRVSAAPFVIACAVSLVSVCAKANAYISGPTTSTGQYTLTWPDGGGSYLREVQSDTNYSSSPTAFSRPPGTYDYEWYVYIFEPEFGLNDYFLVDTHQVVVSAGGGPPPSPPSDTPHIVRVGDLDNDGLLDLAITAADPSYRLVEDFILRQVSAGVFQVVLNPTAAQLQAARSWPISDAQAVVTEFNMNRQFDVAVVNIDAAIPGASDQVILADPSVSGEHPTVVTPIDAERILFSTEILASVADPAYYANALTQQCVSQTGWYLVVAFITQPGWYINEFFQYVYISHPGFYTVYSYLQAGYCFDVIDTNVVSSLPAFFFMIGTEIFSDGDTIAERLDALQIMQAVLADFFGTQIGTPQYQFPMSDIETAEAHYSQIWQVIRNFCAWIQDPFCIPAQAVISAETLCLSELTPQGWATPTRWRMPAVSHPPNQNFQITPAQLSARASNDRLAFWTSRLNDSRDPLGPLAIDVVNDTPVLGCGANRRLSAYAGWVGIQVDLEEVGLSLIDRHITATGQDNQGILGKLDVQRIALYHFDEFDDLGLPRRTFGGTPITGTLVDLRVTRRIWCPSCENFP